MQKKKNGRREECQEGGGDKTMIEYVGKDKKAIGEACRTLIAKCTETKGNNIEMTIQFGPDLFLDCKFAFKINKEHSAERFLK